MAAVMVETVRWYLCGNCAYCFGYAGHPQVCPDCFGSELFQVEGTNYQPINYMPDSNYDMEYTVIRDIFHYEDLPIGSWEVQINPNRNDPSYVVPIEVIENIPSVFINFENVVQYDNCSICGRHFLFNDIARKLPCNHLYHNFCLLTWLQSNNTCPFCGYVLPTNVPGPSTFNEERDSWFTTFMGETRSFRIINSPIYWRMDIILSFSFRNRQGGLIGGAPVVPGNPNIYPAYYSSVTYM